MQAKTSKRSGKGAAKAAALVTASVREVLGQDPKSDLQFAARIAKESNADLFNWVVDMIANEDQPDDCQPKNRDTGWRLMFGIVKAECLRRMACAAA